MLTVMTFNILMGGGDDARFDGILSVIEKASPDILVLQECVGWETAGGRAEKIAGLLGVARDNFFLGLGTPRGSGRRYNVAAFSRLPVRGATTHADGRFLAHCVVDFRVDWAGMEIRILGTHLVARNENLRYVEMHYLTRAILQDDEMRRPVLLLGDLNAMSRRDPYPDDLEERLRRGSIEKYGFPPRFDVIDGLEAHGFVDVLHHAPHDGWITAPRDRGGVHIDYRTDYVFASPPMAEHAVSTRVIPLNGESDHFPVVSTFQR